MDVGIYAKKFLALPILVKIKLLFYPIFLFWQMPIAWVKSICLSCELLDGKWESYMGFDPKTAINYLFYRTQWLNINKFGRKGKSTLLGLGNYELSNFVYLTSFSSYVYAKAGAVVMLVGTAIWCLSHLLWIDKNGALWPFIVTISLFFSTTTYAMAYRLQNYQIIGWMWFPVAIYFMANHMTTAASMAWLAAAVGGVTQVLFATIIVVAYSYESEQWLSAYSIVPVLLFYAIKISIPMLQNANGMQNLRNIMKTIGTTRKDVKYTRDLRIDLETAYFAGHYAFSLVLLWVATYEFPFYVALALVLFFINQTILRVADDRSLFILFATLFAFTVLTHEPSLYVWMITWFAFNPLGVFYGIQSFNYQKGLNNITTYAPFDHMPMKLRIEKFLCDVKPESRIYFAFETPKNYSNIFDGYRFIHELFLYTCNSNEIHTFPDWYTVIQTNSMSNKQPIWGRSKVEVINALNYWDTSYAVVYQEGKSNLASDWLEDFELISSIDWTEPVFNFRGERLWGQNKSTPKWFLIKKRI